MKRVLPFLFLPLGAGLYAQPALEWAMSYGSDRVDESVGVATDAAGNVYVCGYFTQSGDFDPDPSREWLLETKGGADIFVQKFNPDGVLLWAKAWGTVRKERGYAVAVSEADGAIYVAALVEQSDKVAAPHLSKYSSAGDLLWSNTYTSTASARIDRLEIGAADQTVYLRYTAPAPQCWAVSPDGQTKVTRLATMLRPAEHWALGSTWNYAYMGDQQLYVYDAAGIPARPITLALPTTAAVEALLVTPMGLIGVVATMQEGDLVIQQYNAQGVLLWEKPLREWTRLSGWAADRQGRLYLSGKRGDALVLCQWDDKGAMQWQTTLTDARLADLYQLAVHPQGGVLATGYFSEQLHQGLLRPNGSVGANDALLLRWQADNRAAATPENEEHNSLSTVLYAPAPNPAQGQTAIRFEIAAAQSASLRLYDAAGRLIATLWEGIGEGGQQQVMVDVQSFPSGLYYYQLSTPNRQLLQRLEIVEGL